MPVIPIVVGKTHGPHMASEYQINDYGRTEEKDMVTKAIYSSKHSKVFKLNKYTSMASELSRECIAIYVLVKLGRYMNKKTDEWINKYTGFERV